MALAGLLALPLAGDLQIGGDLQVVGGRYAMGNVGGAFGFRHGAGRPPFAGLRAGPLGDGSIATGAGSRFGGQGRRSVSRFSCFFSVVVRSSLHGLS